MKIEPYLIDCGVLPDLIIYPTASAIEIAVKITTIGTNILWASSNGIFPSSSLAPRSGVSVLGVFAIGFGFPWLVPSVTIGASGSSGSSTAATVVGEVVTTFTVL